MTLRTLGAAVAAIVALTGLPMVAQAVAGDPAALITDVTGTPPAGGDMFDEIRSGDLLELPAETVLTFTHYRTCESVTVKGGMLAVSDRAWRTNGGRVIGVERGDCPSSGRSLPESQLGGVVLRSAGAGTVETATRPSIVIVGEKAASIAVVRIAGAGDIRVVDGRLVWPEGTAPLPSRKKVAAELLDASGTIVGKIDLLPSSRKADGALSLIRVN